MLLPESFLDAAAGIFPSDIQSPTTRSISSDELIISRNFGRRSNTDPEAPWLIQFSLDTSNHFRESTSTHANADGTIEPHV
jgi:hypothetical protein